MIAGHRPPTVYIRLGPQRRMREEKFVQKHAGKFKVIIFKVIISQIDLYLPKHPIN